MTDGPLLWYVNRSTGVVALVLLTLTTVLGILATGSRPGRGVPGFVWEGHAIDGLDPALAVLVADETYEMRCVFVWLMFAENISPFQSDIRAA